MLIDVIRNVFTHRQSNHRDLEHYLHGTYIPAYYLTVKAHSVTVKEVYSHFHP